MRSSLPLLALAAILLAAPLASAHASMYTSDGRFKVTFGFLNEPATTWTKTGLDLIITDNATGGPVDGADKTLNATLVYNDQSHDFKLSPQFGTHGRYTDVITMTRPGLYKLHVTGTINGSAVDLLIPAKEATPDINDTYFPDAIGTPLDVKAQMAAMQSEIDALKAQIKTQASTPATVISQTPDASTPASSSPAKPAPGFEPALAVGVLAVVALVVLRRRG